MTGVEPTGQSLRNSLACTDARRRPMRWIAGLAIFAALGIGAGPADAQTLTLETAIRGALRSDNIALQMQEENVKGAQGRLKQAAGQFDWTANARGGWQLLYVGKTDPSGNLLTNKVNAVNSYFYSAGIGREFRNGISIQPGFIGYAGVSAALTGGVTQTRPTLGLNIPLLRGLGEEAADAGERAAQDSLAGTKLGRTFAIAQLVVNVAQTYWRCIADDQILQFAQATDESATNYNETLQKMVKRGLVEPQVAKQNAIGNINTHMNTAAAAQTAHLCRRDLAYATTGSISEPLPTASGELPKIPIMIDAVNHLDKAALIQLALDHRPDLQAAEKTVEATAETLHSAHDNTLPNLSLQIDPDHAIVSYTQSLENDAAEGQEEAAQAANKQAQLNLRQLQDQIRVDVTDALHNLQQAASDWATLNNAEHDMQTIVSNNKRSAQFGAISWQDLVGSQNQLLGIQQQMVTQQLQFANGLAALRLATGSIEMDSETPESIAVKLASLPAL
jgi:outer membrane protein TolC